MAQDATIGATALLKISVLGTVRVFVVLLAGFLASKWPKNEPLLSRETCRCTSRICTLLFLPALIISSTGTTLNPKALRDSWQLIVAGSFTIALSGVMAWGFGRLLLRPEARRAFRPVQLAIAFPNSLVFPLLLMDSLCEQDDINGDYDGDPAECFTRATGMIFIYFVVWQVCFFAWGFYALGDEDTLERKLTGQPPRSPPSATEEGGRPSCNSSGGVLARTEGTLSEARTQKTVVVGDNAVAVDVCVQLGHEAAVASSSARPGHQETNGVDSAQGGFRGGGGSGDGGGEHTVDEELVAAACASNNGVPPRNQGDMDFPPAAGIAPQGFIYLTCKRFLPSRWRSKRGNTVDNNNSSGRAITASDAVKGCSADSAKDSANAESGWLKFRQRILRILVSPNMIGVAAGIIIAMISPLQKMFFDNPEAALRPLGAAIETVGTPSVAVSTLVMAGSLVQVPTIGGRGETSDEGGDGRGGQWNWRRFRFVVGFLHIVCRLVLAPAVGFALFWVLRTQTSVMGENRLMHLILLVELGMPSAAFIVVFLNQLRMPATAGVMAQLYIWQYGSSMFTITLWTAVAVRMVY